MEGNNMTNTILILDDSSSLRQVLAMSLQRTGYKVLEAENGVDALKIVETDENIDLIISDLNMPEMDGLTFISRIRAMDKMKFKPVIMLTTENGEDLKANGMELGVRAWLTKPFMPDQLLDLVSKMLGK
jgi:two-component system, chemotaxis family, chemotaxis protein CheY